MKRHRGSVQPNNAARARALQGRELFGEGIGAPPSSGKPCQAIFRASGAELAMLIHSGSRHDRRVVFPAASGSLGLDHSPARRYFFLSSISTCFATALSVSNTPSPFGALASNVGSPLKLSCR